MKKLVFFVFSSLAVFLITVFFRLGGHKPVDIQFIEYPELNLAFKSHIGPYHTINNVIVAVEGWAASEHVSCKRTFGEYLDDPKAVDERRLRSLGGCVLEKPVVAIAPSEVQTKTVPAKKYVVAKFLGAPSIGPMKVYPKVEEYLKKNNLVISGSVIEIYTIKSKDEAETEYLFDVK